MKVWQEYLLGVVSDEVTCEREIFRRIERAAISIEFEHIAYGFQAPIPLNRPKVTLLNNYPIIWYNRYTTASYIQIDPTVVHGRKSQIPIIWCDKLFANAKILWDDARSHGLMIGWDQSSLDGLGAGGMLTLSRSSQSLSEHEIEANQHKMRWLVQVAHMAFSRLIRHQFGRDVSNLTRKELEVLKWAADGKSAQEIYEILKLSINTVNFHIKNSVVKLQVPNKTAAVVYAAMLGYLR